MAENKTPQSPPRSGRPWGWIPTLYLAEGFPYVLVNTVAAIMFLRLGVDLQKIAFWTSVLGYAWVVKPLWGPLVERYWTKRRWTVLMQILMGVSLAVLAVTMQMSWWWTASLFVLGSVALFSATHDIAADGFYMDALDEKQQSFFVGIRSTFYRLSIIFGQGVLLIIAGLVEERTSPQAGQFLVHASPAAIESNVSLPDNRESFMVVEPPIATIKSGEQTTFTVALKNPPEEESQLVTIGRANTSFLSTVFSIGEEFNVALADRKFETLRFTRENWNIPQSLVVKADKNLKEDVLVQFKGSSGNLHTTWGFCFGLVGALLTVFGLYHLLVLPKPVLDYNPPGVPFLQAAGVMALVVSAPILLYMGLYYGLEWLLPKLNLNLLSPELMKFVKMALILIIGWVMFQWPAFRRLMKSAFSAGARLSQIPYDDVFASFFARPGIGRMITFLLVYRLGEAFLLKMNSLFLQTPVAEGGIGLSSAQYGLAYGTIGVIGLMLGGMTGGVLASRYGLKKWLIPMCLAINLPHFLYVYMAYFQPAEFWKVVLCVSGETFGYGFGFTAYMIYMLYIAGTGEHKTSHFALCTGFMALSMMLPGMISGDIAKGLLNAHQDAPHLGWTWYFVIVCLAIIPSLLILKIIPLDKDFGRRQG